MRRLLVMVCCVLASIGVISVAPSTANADVVQPTAIALSAEGSPLKTGDLGTLTATADAPVYYGAYRVEIHDVTGASDRILSSCSNGDTQCRYYVSAYDLRDTEGAPQTHTYEARLVSDGGAAAGPAGSLVVQSSEVTLSPAAWTVSLTGSGSPLHIGENGTLTAETNQAVAYTAYRLEIRDVTDPDRPRVIATCTSGTTCTGSQTAYDLRDANGAPDDHVYDARVLTDKSSDVANALATSGRVTLSPAAWTVTLQVEGSPVPIGQNAKLTAHANQYATGGGFKIEILDVTNSPARVIATCSNGTDCVAYQSAYDVRDADGAPLPHRYQARIKPDHGAESVLATSDVVEAASAPWQVSLMIEGSPVKVGENATLTATANQAAYYGAFRIEIVDVTSSTVRVISTCTGDSLCKAYVSAHDLRDDAGVPSTHRYIAHVKTDRSDDVAKVLATSAEVAAGTQSWSVDLRATGSPLAVGENGTLVATANQLTYGGAYRIYIVDVTDPDHERVLTSCADGSPCRASVNAYDLRGPDGAPAPRHYIARVLTDRSVPFTMIASSGTVSMEGEPWTVALKADRNPVTVTDYGVLTATANQAAYYGAFKINIVDVTDPEHERVVASCANGPECTASVTHWDLRDAAGAPADHRYVARLLSDTATTTAFASSDETSLTPEGWNVTMSVSEAPLTGTTPAKLTVATNQPFGGVYWVSFYDVTNGDRQIGGCSSSGSGCALYVNANELRDSTGRLTPHTYEARLISNGATDALTLDTSNTVTVTRARWTGAVFFDADVDKDAGTAQLKAHAGARLADGQELRIMNGQGDQLLSCGASQGCGLTVAAMTAQAQTPITTYTAEVVDAGEVASTAMLELRGDMVVDVIMADIDVEAMITQAEVNANRGWVGDVCDAFLFAPGTHTQGSSTSDEYNDCETSIGRPLRERIMALVRKYGPMAAVTAASTYVLTADTNQPASPPQIDKDAAGKPTRSLPTGVTTKVHISDADVQRVATYLEQKLYRSGDTAPQEEKASRARSVARNCLTHVAKYLPAAPGNACEDEMIFAPGKNVQDAAKHDLEAIEQYAPWVQLHYSMAAKRKAAGIARIKDCPSGEPGKQCDEYPYYGSREGSADHVGPRPSSRLVITGHNQDEGNGRGYAGFVNNCRPNSDDLNTKSGGDSFLVLPMTADDAPDTLWYCGKDR